MTEWITVISLILFGLTIILVEIIFVPGTTVVGLLGFLFLVTGLVLSFRYFGSETGWVISGTSAAVAGAMIYFSFKSNVWGRFSLKSTIKSKVNEGVLLGLNEGIEGTALSALRPSGNAEILNKTYEVKTLGEYVDSGTKIRIIKIISNQIIVEPLN